MMRVIVVLTTLQSRGPHSPPELRLMQGEPSMPLQHRNSSCLTCVSLQVYRTLTSAPPTQVESSIMTCTQEPKQGK